MGPDGAPRKKARAGFVAQQWITVYNKHEPMKQRCAAASPHPCARPSHPPSPRTTTVAHA